MTVIIPNTFASATSTIPLSQLDQNFNVLASSINAIANGSQTISALSVLTITGGSASLTGLSVSGSTTLDDLTASGATVTNLTVSGAATIGADLTISGGTHIREVAEYVNIQAVAASGTINLDWNDGAVLFLTATGTANFEINIRGESAVDLNSVLATGEAAGFSVVVTQDSNAYQQDNFLVDGVTATVYWQGGSQPSGSIAGLDVYAGTVIKTGNASFVVLESMTNFGA